MSSETRLPFPSLPGWSEGRFLFPFETSLFSFCLEKERTPGLSNQAEGSTDPGLPFSLLFSLEEIAPVSCDDFPRDSSPAMKETGSLRSCEPSYSFGLVSNLILPDYAPT